MTIAISTGLSWLWPEAVQMKVMEMVEEPRSLDSRFVVIVDGLATGALLGPAFKAQGYEVLHVKTSNRIAADLEQTFTASDYSFCLDYQDLGMEKTSQILRDFPVRCVVPGCDSGVVVADTLAARLGVGSNDVEKVMSRRSKFLMHEALREAGLASARQWKSDSVEELIDWYSQQDFRKVVVKPEFGARSEGVVFCSSADDVSRAFAASAGVRNLFGIINSELVIQEYLAGDEFIVNTVSVGGEHFVTDIWLGVDEDEEQISTDLYADLVEPQDERHTTLSAYVVGVLDCLGIRTGPAHVEVRLTAHGPVLIEIGARLTGQLPPPQVIGLDAVALTVAAYISPTNALRELQEAARFRPARLVYLRSDIGGPVLSSPDISAINALESLQQLAVRVRPGDTLVPTNHVGGRPGYAYLVHDERAQLEMDYERLRLLEREMYELMLRGPAVRHPQ